MRRTDRQLTELEIEPILQNAEYGILSTIGQNGYPYSVPLNFVYCDGRIYFHCALDVGSKITNMLMNPKVCFVVVGHTKPLPDKFSTEYESVIIFGQAENVSDSKKQMVLEELIHKYSKGFEESGAKYIQSAASKVSVFEIRIEHITGKVRKADKA